MILSILKIIGIIYLSLGIICSTISLIMFTMYGSKYNYRFLRLLYVHLLIVLFWFPVICSVINDRKKVK